MYIIGQQPKIGTPRPFGPFIGILHIAELRKRLAAPARDWPTVHRTYEWLKTPRYTYGRLIKLGITYKWLQEYP